MRQPEFDRPGGEHDECQGGIGGVEPVARRMGRRTLVFIPSTRPFDRIVDCIRTEDLTDRERVRITHPFHPWAGQEFEFVKRRKNWRADRAYVVGAGGELVSVPAAWTDVVVPDTFVVVSAGRSPFHVADLVELAHLVEELAARRQQRVKETSP